MKQLYSTFSIDLKVSAHLPSSEWITRLQQTWQFSVSMSSSHLNEEGRPPGGTARLNGLGAPRKVQWIDESPAEGSGPTHGLDEGGLNVSSLLQSKNIFGVYRVKLKCSVSLKHLKGSPLLWSDIEKHPRPEYTTILLAQVKRKLKELRKRGMIYHTIRGTILQLVHLTMPFRPPKLLLRQ